LLERKIRFEEVFDGEIFRTRKRGYGRQASVWKGLRFDDMPVGGAQGRRNDDMLAGRLKS
jgi:hypothetical protein